MSNNSTSRRERRCDVGNWELGTAKMLLVRLRIIWERHYVSIHARVLLVTVTYAFVVGLTFVGPWLMPRWDDPRIRGGVSKWIRTVQPSRALCGPPADENSGILKSQPKTKIPFFFSEKFPETTACFLTLARASGSMQVAGTYIRATRLPLDFPYPHRSSSVTLPHSIESLRRYPGIHETLL